MLALHPEIGLALLALLVYAWPVLVVIGLITIAYFLGRYKISINIIRRK